MRILMVGAKFSYMMDDVRSGLDPSCIDIIKVSSGIFNLKDGSEIHVLSVQKPHDLEKLRGRRFDFVIEHHSFPRDAELYHLLRAYTQR